MGHGMWEETPAKAEATLGTSREMGRSRNASENTGKDKDETEYLSGVGGEWTSEYRCNILPNLSSPQNMTLLKKQAYKQEHKKYRTVITIIQRLEECRNTDLYPVMDNDPGASP